MVEYPNGATEAFTVGTRNIEFVRSMNARQFCRRIGGDSEEEDEDEDEDD